REGGLHGPYAPQPTDYFFCTQWQLEHRNAGILLGAGQEVPSGGGRMGSGTGLVSLCSTNFLSVTVNFSGLSTNATAAAIHGPAAPGVNAPALYVLQAPAATSGTIGTSITLRDGVGGFSLAQQVQQLDSGQWYLNIRTVAFPQGEIRGQITYGSSAGPDLNVRAAW